MWFNNLKMVLNLQFVDIFISSIVSIISYYLNDIKQQIIKKKRQLHIKNKYDSTVGITAWAQEHP